MPEVRIVAEQPVQLAPFLLRGAPRPGLPAHDGRHGHARANWREVLVAGGRNRRAHALFQKLRDPKDAIEAVHPVAHLIAHLDRTRRLNRIAVDPHVARLALRGGQ